MSIYLNRNAWLLKYRSLLSKQLDRLLFGKHCTKQPRTITGESALVKTQRSVLKLKASALASTNTPTFIATVVALERTVRLVAPAAIAQALGSEFGGSVLVTFNVEQLGVIIGAPDRTYGAVMRRSLVLHREGSLRDRALCEEGTKRSDENTLWWLCV